MDSPWAKVPTPDLVNLQDIISEEVIKRVQAVKNEKDIKVNVLTNQKEISDNFQKSPIKIGDESACDQDSDAVIARLLQEQEQFMEGHDTLKKALNGTINIPVLFEDSRVTLQNFEDESELEKEKYMEEFHDHKDWEQSEVVQREIIKHDFTLNYPCSGLYTSNETDLDVKFKVLKSLKTYQKRGRAVIDDYSAVQIYKMIKRKMFKSVDSITSRGKETVILHAESDPAYPGPSMPKECALKIFKLDGCKKTNILAEKEWHNLRRLHKAGIPCPLVVALEKNILVLSFIGENAVRAPRLKDAVLTDDECVLAYNQVVKALDDLYNKANLIYPDLSEDKIFWHNQQCYFMGLCEPIEVSRYETFYFFKNCKNIVEFFGWKGVPNIATARELFTQITQIKDN